MAHSDYTKRGATLPFCPVAKLTAAITPLAATLTYGNLSSSISDPIKVGMAIMIDDEILGITGISGTTLDVSRGCCDTVPAAHFSNANIWFFDDSIGSDEIEYGGSETVGAKVLPRTATGAAVPISGSPPNELQFNFRFARPYPPANVKVDGVPWFTSGLALDESNSEIALTWSHRDRITQADQLIDHGAASIGPEAGVTYKVVIKRASTGAVVKTVTGISGTTWSYTREEASNDLDSYNETIGLNIELMSVRGSFESLKKYSIAVRVETVLVDEHWDNVIALLQMEGENGSQVLVNAAVGGANPTVVGTGALSTAQKKTGASSWKGASGSQFELVLGSDGLFAGDFTFEWYGYETQPSQVTFYSVTGLNYLYNGSFQGYGGSALNAPTNSGPGNDNWVHFALCREGNTLRFKRNGVQTGSVTYTGTVDLRTTRWGLYVPNNNLYNTGYIDMVRVTKNVNRYPGAANFDPPQFMPGGELLSGGGGGGGYVSIDPLTDSRTALMWDGSLAFNHSHYGVGYGVQCAPPSGQHINSLAGNDGLLHNDGSTWWLHREAHAAFGGKTAIRFHVKQGQTVWTGDTIRAELHGPSAPGTGTNGSINQAFNEELGEYWLARRFTIGSDLAASGETIAIGGLHDQDWSTWPHSDGQDSMSLWITNGNILTWKHSLPGNENWRVFDVRTIPMNSSFTWGPPGGGAFGSTYAWQLANLTAGVPINVIVRIKMNDTNTGTPRTEVWIRIGTGALTKVVDYYGPNTFSSGYRYWKWGIYKFYNTWSGFTSLTHFVRRELLMRAVTASGLPDIDADALDAWLNA